MEKAYDVKALVEQLKGHGLDLAEDAAKIAVEELFIWIEKSAGLSENKYDDLLLAILPLIKAEVLKQVDKIDQQQG